MGYGIDPTSDRAAFRQIADQLRDDMVAGRLAEGQQLPSERQLMELFDASRGTIRQAVAILRSEGLVEPQHGRGVFVRSRPPVRRLASDRFARRHREAGKAAFMAEMEVEGREPEVEVLEVGPGAASPEVARRLGVEPGEQVLVRSRRYLADGQPLELATSYLPWAISEDTPIAQSNPGAGGIYARLEEIGHSLDHFTEEVTARMPAPEEARALRLTDGVPVIALVRTAFDTSGAAVEVCDTVMAADRYVLTYTLPAS